MKGMGKVKDQDEKLHRLTDIVVEEVSIVDRPANLQPFLVVKRATPEVGGEVLVNDDGELVIAKSDDKSDDEKEKRIAAARKQLVSALEAGDDAAVDLAMKELAKARAYTSDEDEKEGSDREPTEKAGAAMSKERMEQLAQAIEALVALKDSLNPATGPTAGSAQARKDDDEGGVTDLLVDVTKRLDTMAGSIGKLHEVVRDQEKRIRKTRAKVSKRDETVVSNRIAVEKGRRLKAEPTTAWPMDLNREETPANTPKHRSFFDD